MAICTSSGGSLQPLQRRAAVSRGSVVAARRTQAATPRVPLARMFQARPQPGDAERQPEHVDPLAGPTNGISSANATNGISITSRRSRNPAGTRAAARHGGQEQRRTARRPRTPRAAWRPRPGRSRATAASLQCGGRRGPASGRAGRAGARGPRPRQTRPPVTGGRRRLARRRRRAHREEQPAADGEGHPDADHARPGRRRAGRRRCPRPRSRRAAARPRVVLGLADRSPCPAATFSRPSGAAEA